MNDPGTLFTFLGLLLGLAVYVWTAASLSAVFAKAGVPAFTAWVPVYGIAVLLRLAGLSGWLVLLAFVPVLNLAFLVVLIIACHRVGRGFGVGGGMTVLAALVFPVWTSILGWGSARWVADDHFGPVRRGEASVRSAEPTPTGAAGPVPARTTTPAAAVPADFVVPPRPPAPHPITLVDDLDDDLPLGRSHAPFTQTVPTSFTPPADAVPPPATPRRALAGDPVPPLVTDVPARAVPTAGPVDPWAPRPATAPVPTVRTRAAQGQAPADAGFDTSAEVSAVVGAPSLGAPRAARGSVSSLHDEPHVPGRADEVDDTVLAGRRRVGWSLVPPLGGEIAITSEVLIVGRRPGRDAGYAHAQLVPVPDETRTISKTHARLELHGDAWLIIDLDSTNGVVLLDATGGEHEVPAGVPTRLTERFLLGDAELRLQRIAGG